MALYAIVNNGTVAGPFVSPPDGQTLQQVSGLTSAQIAAAVAVPAGVPVAIGWLESGGTFSPPGGTPTLTLAQQAAAAIGAGVSIASTGTPAVNRAYALDAASRATMAEVVAGINASDGLPGGGSSFTYIDSLGSVAIPSATVCLAIAKAMRDTLYTLMLIATGAAGAPASLPQQPVTIA